MSQTIQTIQPLGHIFVPNQSYEWELPLVIGVVSRRKLIEALSETGQVFGIMAPLIMEAYFTNLTFEYDKPSQSRFLRDDQGRIWRTIVATKGNAANLLPSKMKGSGRPVDEREHKERQLQLAGYILMDLEDLPMVRMTSVFITELASGQETISRADLHQLLYHDQADLF